MILSIVIPAYNEGKTIHLILDKVKVVNLPIGFDKEIIIVNDFSKDNTEEAILNYKHANPELNIHYYKHNVNKGKGAALHTGIKEATGDYIIIQDADLEYDPTDYYKLLECIMRGYNVVYGSRVLGGNRYLSKNFSSFMRIFYNHVLTILSNIINNQKLTDAHTCYKMFNSNIFKKIKLEENDFSFCPEITTKIALLKIKIKEIPIKYNGRNYSEGKKIKFIDGVKAIITLFKYRFFK